jgi:bifunctional DNA-binding transcriptional regulator/antitoxin component of YhaV-PrlF toxin-antitoxin module
VPKPLRQALGLKTGQPLEIRAGDGRLEVETEVLLRGWAIGVAHRAQEKPPPGEGEEPPQEKPPGGRSDVRERASC